MLKQLSNCAHRLLLLALLSLASFTGDAAVTAEMSIAQKVERSVVILTHTAPSVTNVLGTGFVVSTNGDVVTADHVAFDEKAGVVHASIFAIWDSGTELRTVRLEVSRRFKKGVVGRDVAILKPAVPTRIGLSYLNIGGTAALGKSVIIAGYPFVWDEVKAFPLLRTGVIASTKYESEGNRVLVLDLPSVQGYSGSPIVDAKTGLVVGVLSRAPKRPDTGFSIAYEITPDDMITGL